MVGDMQPENTVSRPAGPAGLVIVVIGLVLLTLSTFVLDWTEARFSDGGLTYFELSKRVLSTNAQQIVSEPNGFAIAYFDGLGLLFFTFVAVVSVLTTWPGARRRTLLRVVAIVGVLVAAAALVAALPAVSERADLLGGPFVAIIGYAAVLVGVLIGGSKR